MSTESARVVQSSTPTSFRPSQFSDQHSLAPEKRPVLQYASLFITDALILGGATYLAYGASLTFDNVANFVALGVVVGVWLTMLHFNGFYNLRLMRPAHQLAYDLVKSTGMSVLAGSAIFFLIPAISVPREAHWSAALASGILLLLWRLAHLSFIPLTQIKKRALFVGPTEIGVQIAEEIQTKPESNYEVVGFIDNQENQSQMSSRLLFGEDLNLLQIVRDHRINSIILPDTKLLPESTLKALADCSELGCELISPSRLYEQISGRIPVQYITHGWLVSELNQTNRTAYRLGKRLMDLTLSILGLMATALLFPVIALLIKLDSPGPIFYSQIRAGRHGRPFKIYKFRSMVHNAERTGAVWAQVNDKRVTKLGEFLRKTRLDELPQLYNILVGEMSLVGPRPERPEFVEKLAQEIPFFSKRQMVLPGLTGWAQVNYPYGASTEDALQKLQYDLYYIKNSSMFLDIEILLRTVSVVINMTGAR